MSSRVPAKANGAEYRADTADPWSSPTLMKSVMSASGSQLVILFRLRRRPSVVCVLLLAGLRVTK